MTQPQPDWASIAERFVIDEKMTVHIRQAVDGSFVWTQETLGGTVPVNWADIADQFIVEDSVRIERVDSPDGTHWWIVDTEIEYGPNNGLSRNGVWGQDYAAGQSYEDHRRSCQYNTKEEAWEAYWRWKERAD